MLSWTYFSLPLSSDMFACDGSNSANVAAVALSAKSGLGFHCFDGYAQMLGSHFGNADTLYCCDTLQLDDYADYYASMFNEAAKRMHREEQLPKDLQTACEIGGRAARGA